MAMAMRYARVVREGERREMEASGRRVVAEVPSHEGDVYLFMESPDAFEWQGRAVAKSEIVGCRLLLNGGLMASAARPGRTLPEPTAPEAFEGRERWDVRVYQKEGFVDVPCGMLREGVSREAARAVYESMQAILAEQK